MQSNLRDKSRPGVRGLLLRIVAVMAATSLPLVAHFAIPSEVPVERLIKNLSAYIKEHPQHSRGYYLLARVHSLALSQQRNTVLAYDPGWTDDKLPVVDHQFHDARFLQRTPEKAPPAPAELKDHAQEALHNFARAIELEPNNGLYHLGLAFTLEAAEPLADSPPPGLAAPAPPSDAEAAEWEGLAGRLADASYDVREKAFRGLKDLGPRALPVLLRHREDADAEVRTRTLELIRLFWRERAVQEYLKAHTLSFDSDMKDNKQKPLSGMDSLVSYEAGHAYIRLVKARGAAESDPKDVVRVTANLKTLDDIPPNHAVTPILFPLDGNRSLAGLLAPDVRVSFNLDGTGSNVRWPWVRPDTGILVWDPNGRGYIESGRRLFGSVTWWMFWEDGYHALDALDDDRDGALAGNELRGLAVWRDANGNGASDPGEVVPVEALGIVRIEARAKEREDGSPCNRKGLRLRDGRVLPTYDWIVSRPRREKDGAHGMTQPR